MSHTRQQHKKQLFSNLLPKEEPFLPDPRSCSRFHGIWQKMGSRTRDNYRKLLSRGLGEELKKHTSYAQATTGNAEACCQYQISTMKTLSISLQTTRRPQCSKSKDSSPNLTFYSHFRIESPVLPSEFRLKFFFWFFASLSSLEERMTTVLIICLN